MSNKLGNLRFRLSVAVSLTAGALACALGAGAAPQERVKPKAQEVTNSLGIKLVMVPAGKFLMGSPESEPERAADEVQHEVKITKPFFLGVHEVTQEHFKKIMQKNPSWFMNTGGGKDRLEQEDTSDFPVEEVTWHEAAEFCKKLSDRAEEKKHGRVYRLPSEAEWEYACRAGTTTPVSYGKSLNGFQANFCGLAPYPIKGKHGPDLGITRPGGAYDPNDFGLYDMHGNVHEWVADWYGPYPTEPVEDPKGPQTGKQKIARGGCWLSTGRSCRAAMRHKFTPETSHYGIGFRVLLEAR